MHLYPPGLAIWLVLADVVAAASLGLVLLLLLPIAIWVGTR